MTNDQHNAVEILLAIATLLYPVCGAAIFGLMFKFFPTRKEFEAQEANQKIRHEENQARFETLEGDIKTLLQR